MGIVARKEKYLGFLYWTGRNLEQKFRQRIWDFLGVANLKTLALIGVAGEKRYVIFFNPKLRREVGN